VITADDTHNQRNKTNDTNDILVGNDKVNDKVKVEACNQKSAKIREIVNFWKKIAKKKKK